MQLHDVWFVLIAFLWTGYFFLEGFDFGIGVLTRILARDAEERGVLLATIGPVWDGNEVWMLTAVGATFAAFPDWYAALCSGFYLPLLALLVCLIVRGVALEYRAKRADVRWRRTCDRCVLWTSVGCAYLWGLVFANMVRGVPIGPDGNFTGTALDLLHPYALLGGCVTLCLFTLHGALFAALKTTGAIRRRARDLARRLTTPTVVAMLLFVFWTQIHRPAIPAFIVLTVAVAALFLVAEMTEKAREGWAFALSGLTVAALVAGLFLDLFPEVMPSSTDPAWSLTVQGAASSPYTLTILTWVAAFGAPVVIAYQAWTYWVFRRRIGVTRRPERAAAHR
ncbi:cytochrome d ubiquinol oxidase subunit II [Streptomyces sp. NBC_00503]|uniref:cytochrome d ubiquinol oxidase subunit II n=1 Tax=Streptomyces sp. NBC_00503 TaxID=2903659 RepID=UPI002E80B0D7|nr:cytochrome d ubiquinol oxidase subunit II [Streptomyces sp. NBC_00503]WUD82240.1 cytochrome d ubiquinol oxidase subunit II [Streptomyces sp. NBC_00503]